MDRNSETETVVEESEDLCDSPSILTGLFQIRHALSETSFNDDDIPQRSPEGGVHNKGANATAVLMDEADDAAPKSSRDDTSTHKLSQQSEESLSIFTQRIPEKRKSPIVTLPNSPAFTREPAAKLARPTDGTSSNTTMCTHLDTQSPSGDFQADHDQTANTSPRLRLPNSQTQSSNTTIPSVKDISQDPKHPSVPILLQRQATPVVSVSLSLGSTLASPPNHNPEAERANSLISKSSGSLDWKIVPHQKNLGDSGSADEDGDSLVEIERMQEEIRGRMSSRYKDFKDADQIKRSLQEMQVRLRHLSARQREHRSQLSLRIKQQAVASSSSSQSQQQQQETRIQLQQMTRRQQHLLKLLQSHKELAAALQQMQCTERSDKQQHQTLGRSPDMNDTIKQVQQGNDIMQNSSADCSTSRNTILPTESEEHMPSFLSSPAQTAVTLSSSREQPTPQSERTMPSTCQVFQIPTPSKPADEASSARTFKPPFKANQPKRPQPVLPKSTISLANNPSNSDPQPETERLSLAISPEKSQSTFETAVRHTPSPTPVTTGSRSNYSPQSPPFSSSSDTSKDMFLSETTGVLGGKDGNDVLSQQNQNDESRQEVDLIQTEMTPCSPTNFSVDDGGRDTASKAATPASTKVPPVSSIPAQNASSVEPIPTSDTPCKTSLCVLQDQASKIPQAGPQNLEIPSKYQELVSQLLTKLQQKEADTRQGTDAPRSMPARCPPRQVVIYRVNCSQSSTSVTTPVDLSVPGTVSTAAPIGERCCTSSLAGNQTSSVRNQIPSLPGSSLSSRFTVAPIESQTKLSRAARSNILAATSSGMVSTSDPRHHYSPVKSQNAVVFPGNKTQRIFTSQGRTPGQAGASIQTVVHSSGPNKRQPGSGCESSGASEPPSLLDLLQKRLVEPGENVLSVKVKRGTINASLHADGTVIPSTKLSNFTRGSLCQMLSAVKHKPLKSIKTVPNIWKTVFYKGKPLNTLQTEYKALITRSQQSENQPNEGLAPNIQATVTTKVATLSIADDPPRTTSDSIHPAPPSSISHSNPTSSIDHYTTSSRCHDLTSSVSHDSGSDLVLSLQRVLLISDDELMPASWEVSPNFWDVDNIQNASISPEWIQEMDVWT